MTEYLGGRRHANDPDTKTLRVLACVKCGERHTVDVTEIAIEAETSAGLREALDPEAMRLELGRLAEDLTVVIDDAESQHPGGWGPDITTVRMIVEVRDDLARLAAYAEHAPAESGYDATILQGYAGPLPAPAEPAVQPLYCLNADGHSGKHGGWVNGEWSVTDEYPGPILHTEQSDE